MFLEQVAVVVEDYDPAIEFFVGALGFELVEDSPALTSSGGRPKRWVVVRPPGARTGILLARADGEEQAAAVGRQFAGRVGLFVRVDDFDAEYERMRAAGVEFVGAPRAEPYGRVAVFLDIAGNRWDLLGRAEGAGDERDWKLDPGVDLDAFLARPLVARVAAAGPSVRPVWFLWEDQAFWWLTGGWSALAGILGRDPECALVVDTCDLETGEVLQVTARGAAEVLPFDAGRARRKLSRYLGPDEAAWDRERFLEGTFEDPTARFVRLAPRRLRARDLSFNRHGAIP